MTTPLLVRVDNLNTQTSSQYAYARSPVRIGRNPLNDLALEFPFVSQWHAVVQFDDNVTQFIDLGSTNGTAVNGQRVGKNMPVPLAPNLEFRIGALRIYFARGPAPPHLLNQRQGNLGGGFGAQTGSSEAGGSDRTMMASGSGEATMMFDVAAAGAHDPRLAAAVQAAQAGVNPAQLQSLTNQLRPLYDAYRQSWNTFYKSATAQLSRVPPEALRATLAHLQQELPAIAGEDEFRALAQSQQVTLFGAAGVAHAAGTLVGQMSQYFVPQAKAVESGGDVERMLVRVAAVLDAFSASFVALRKGYNEFGSEMALPSHRSMNMDAPLSAPNDARQVLSYLLDWTVDAQGRVQELASAYADIMIHQVALLNGMVEGVRSLLFQIGPAAIAYELANTPGPKFLRSIWPFRSGALWKRYAQRHAELTEEDRQMTKALFGHKFLEAYGGVVGKNFTDSGPPRLNEANRR